MLINGQNSIERKDLLLATCSETTGLLDCSFDEGITKIKLKIILDSPDGQKTLTGEIKL
jgi:hypothetical protein